LNHVDHLLIIRPVVARCYLGHEAHLFTTDGATCSCGKWSAWASTRKEIDYSHTMHLEFVKQQEQEQAVQQYQRDIGLHQLEWRGPKAGACRGCSWQVYGLDGPRIAEAHSLHRENIRKELERTQ
jgi:hypothetical protein